MSVSTKGHVTEKGPEDIFDIMIHKACFTQVAVKTVVKYFPAE